MNPEVGDGEALIASARAILPASAALRAWTRGEGEPPLFPAEAEAVARAVPSRRREFARGRACARDALAALGGPRASIAVGRSREPLWPSGFVGSITHCEGLVAAVAAVRDSVVCIGLDAELAKPLPAEIREHVLHPAERSRHSPPTLETVIFSAKESIHKALFPLEGVSLDFLDVRLEIDAATGIFAARAVPEARSRSRHLEDLVGRFVTGRHHVVTACWQLPGAEPRP